MRARDRDILAGFMAVVALVLGAAAGFGGRIDPGLVLGLQYGPDKGSERIVVMDVDPSGPAAMSGVSVGAVVVSLNGVAVLPLPGWDPNARVEVPDPSGDKMTLAPFSPEPTPVVTQLDVSYLQSLLDQPIYDMSVVRPDLLDRPLDPNSYLGTAFNVGGWSGIVQTGLLAWGLGVAILLLGGWWLATGRAGESIRSLAIPAVAATATPLLLFPFRAVGGPFPYASSSIVAALALLPLADGLIARQPLRNHRLALQAGAIVLAAAAAILGGAVEYMSDYPNRSVIVWWFTASAVTIVPGILAARPVPQQAGDGAPSTPSGRLLDATEFAVLGLTPAIAFFTFIQARDGPYIQPIILWLAVVLVAGRFTIRPLARLATRAQLQRDLVVATMEAERARIATNIHDDALQDVTLLVRRLDDAGDGEGAELARGVADRLRTISGDLRLPILDDLGVGPALDWLVSRMERMAGGEVRLELADGTRPPAAVELAVFRIAQEAL
ncbi:MAG TPA: hypothetical protein VK656_03655, partial [Candidatus Acidoferrum sp.]|nr:hypothetical protein [Candidatus Acidoferrum sp.]